MLIRIATGHLAFWLFAGCVVACEVGNLSSVADVQLAQQCIQLQLQAIEKILDQNKIYGSKVDARFQELIQAEGDCVKLRFLRQSSSSRFDYSEMMDDCNRRAEARVDEFSKIFAAYERRSPSIKDLQDLEVGLNIKVGQLERSVRRLREQLPK